MALALLACACLVTSARAGDDGYTGRVVKWKAVGWYDITALPDDKSCSATVKFEGGTSMIIIGTPTQFMLTLADNRWAGTFLKGQAYAPTIELDNEWANLAVTSTFNGSITIDDMGKAMVTAFMEADALGISMNGGERMAVLDLKYTRSMMHELANCAVTMSTGNVETSSF